MALSENPSYRGKRCRRICGRSSFARATADDGKKIRALERTLLLHIEDKRERVVKLIACLPVGRVDRFLF